MKLFGLFGKDKAAPFPEFRDHVRLAVRRATPGSKVENTDTGINLYMADKSPIACNLRNLYMAYSKDPGRRDELISNWIDSLITEPPEQGWSEAKLTLRPMLKPNDYVERARIEMRKGTTPDSLPAIPFAGDLSVIVMREVGRNVFGVTDRQLEEWGIDLNRAMMEAINNMNMMTIPPVTNELTVGASSKKGGFGGEVVGLVFEGDHLTATWITLERFRDHVSMKLQGNYVVAIPNRNRLIAVRDDEPGLISSTLQSNRNYSKQPYPLTSQCYHISMAATGGIVTVYKGLNAATSVAGKMDPNSVFSGGNAAKPTAGAAKPGADAGYSKPQPVDLGNWGGLTESTDDGLPPTPWNRGKS